jgi:GTP-binding nuclear protein Ran
MLSIKTMMFSICVLGPRESGKSAFIERHLTGDFVKDYVPSKGLRSSILTLNTNYGKVTLTLLDSDSIVEADAYLVIGSITDCDVQYHLKDIVRKLPNKPTVLAINKVDLPKWDYRISIKHLSLYKDLTKELGRQFPLILLSTKSNYNYEKPLTNILRMLTWHEDLHFIE